MISHFAQFTLAMMLSVTALGSILAHGRTKPASRFDARWPLAILAAEALLIWLAVRG